MAKKFKIEQNPTFKSEVEIPRVGAETIKVEFEFKYLSRKELASVYDSWQELAKAIELSDKASFAELTDVEIQLQVTQIKDIVIGWGFEDEFSDENIVALVESSVHTSSVIVEAFQSAYNKAKAGN